MVRPNTQAAAERMRRKIEDELDDLWREIIYLQYNFTCLVYEVFGYF